MPRLRLKVRGEVQGVGFRRFIWNCARAFGLTGTVRNCRDRSVEIEAEGERPALDRLIEVARRGPGRVHELVEDWEDGPARHREFRIVAETDP